MSCESVCNMRERILAHIRKFHINIDVSYFVYLLFALDEKLMILFYTIRYSFGNDRIMEYIWMD